MRLIHQSGDVLCGHPSDHVIMILQSYDVVGVPVNHHQFIRVMQRSFTVTTTTVCHAERVIFHVDSCIVFGCSVKLIMWIQLVLNES